MRRTDHDKDQWCPFWSVFVSLSSLKNVALTGRTVCTAGKWLNSLCNNLLLPVSFTSDRHPFPLMWHAFRKKSETNAINKISTFQLTDSAEMCLIRKITLLWIMDLKLVLTVTLLNWQNFPLLSVYTQNQITSKKEVKISWFIKLSVQPESLVQCDI